MQDKKPIPNADRRAAMRQRLIDAARTLFVAKGYGETSTPEIVRTAEVTRGALYHHFADKADLFRAVVVQEAAEVAAAIEQEAQAEDTPLLAGSRAFFHAMTKPGRAQLLLVQGPAVLGSSEMRDIDAGGGLRTLQEGLRAARPDLAVPLVEALALTLSAAFDRAALAIAEGAEEELQIQAMTLLMAGLMPAPGSSEPNRN